MDAFTLTIVAIVLYIGIAWRLARFVAYGESTK